MDLIQTSIRRPIAVIAAVLMVVMFGAVALQSIPIQLTPDVRKPIIQIRTNWPGAAPAEVEREIINPQEDVLKGLEGLDEITSRSQDGRGGVTLEFRIGQDMDKAILLTANRLDRVSGYPDEASEPTISTSDSEDSPIAWFMLRRAAGNDRPMHTFGDFAEDVIQDRLERVTGVSLVNVYGGAAREMVIEADPERMARYGLTVTEVVATLRAANASVSAGDLNEGKRRYVVRTEGQFETPDDIRNVVLRSDSSAETGRLARVTVGDIADVRLDYKEPRARIRVQSQPAISVNAVRETGANVIEVMQGLREAAAELNAGPLPDAGLTLTQVYDETVYIDSAINLVRQNIIVGGALAAVVLLTFLRSARATLVVSLAIPVSVIGSFVAMAALGRSLNVISLAGIAFAVGMVVDAAIVVLENIYRCRERGLSAPEAAYEGAKRVWGAVLVSALTTVMVFIPILLMDLEVGQLFRDIAVAISVSVLLSLVVAVTVIPALAQWLLGNMEDPALVRLITRPLRPAGMVLAKFAALFHGAVMAFTRRVISSKALSAAVVIIVCGTAGAGTWAFLPKLDYLPDGNRNLVFGVILPPPGYNLDTTAGIASRIENQVRPLWAGDDIIGEEDLAGAPAEDAEGRALMSRFFFVATRSNTFLGAAAVDASRVGELIPPLRSAAFSEPGTFGIINQTSLFGRGFSGGRTIVLNVTGPELEPVLDTALRAVGKIGVVLPRSEGTQIRPRPGLELGAPEVRVLPDRVKLADNGVSARELGDTIDAFNDGLRVAEITVGGERRDLTLKGPGGGVTETQGVGNLPVVTSSGTILPARSLATVLVTSGPTEIRHLERVRTVTLDIRPPETMPLETAIEIIKSEVTSVLEAEGVPEGVRFRLSGTADKLSQTWNAMVLDLMIAVVIVYLVMAVLFESFVYPLIILLSAPLATAGGVAGLALVNAFVTRQPLDMLTLLGFVILIGIVVNNAILLVHQTLRHLREDGMETGAAILEATSNRIRPIFMSTLTSVCGMLPLVLAPGAGSELYRGLGSVVVGGLALSAVLTLVIIPPLLALFASAVETRRGAGQPGLRADAQAAKSAAE
ncbi:MAG: efflux RND transporter permease subunit [Rhodospirillales bacterium]